MRIIKIFAFTIAGLLLLALLLMLALFFWPVSTKNITPTTHAYLYELPYAPGEMHKVIQGYDGLFSHQHIAAVDFQMALNTRIFAARAGRVFAYKDDSDEGGPFEQYQDKANYIIIQHNDGSFGCYWHLAKNGVKVKRGFVRQGQEIGSSGATGFVLFPHLHFSVKSRLSYDADAYVQTRFRTGSGPAIPRAGRLYRRPFQ